MEVNVKKNKDTRTAADILDQLRKEHFAFSQVNPDHFPDFSGSDRTTDFLRARWNSADKAGRVMILRSLLENERAKERRIQDLITEAESCLSDSERKLLRKKEESRTVRPQKKQSTYQRLILT
jgi:hypothetical protein